MQSARQPLPPNPATRPPATGFVFQVRTLGEFTAIMTRHVVTAPLTLAASYNDIPVGAPLFLRAEFRVPEAEILGPLYASAQPTLVCSGGLANVHIAVRPPHGLLSLAVESVPCPTLRTTLRLAYGDTKYLLGAFQDLHRRMMGGSEI